MCRSDSGKVGLWSSINNVLATLVEVKIADPVRYILSYPRILTLYTTIDF
jgi:hypothetical protein